MSFKPSQPVDNHPLREDEVDDAILSASKLDGMVEYRSAAGLILLFNDDSSAVKFFNEYLKPRKITVDDMRRQWAQSRVMIPVSNGPLSMDAVIIDGEDHGKDGVEVVVFAPNGIGVVSNHKFADNKTFWLDLMKMYPNGVFKDEGNRRMIPLKDYVAEFQNPPMRLS